MGWDACALDEIYRNLYSPAPSGAQIYVEDTCEPNNFNDYEGSNKTIATNKGWKVMLEYNCGAEKQLTGDGGGCKPGAVTCLSPTNGATNVSVNDVKLRFGFGANTSQYQFKWGKDSNNFSNVTSYKTTGGNTGFALAMPKLDFNTTYYWQINVKDKNGNERMGEIWSFTTEADSKPGAITRPPKVKLSGIKNGDELKWIFGENTSEYKLLLGTSSTPKDVVVPFTSSLATSYTLSNLKYNTKYYWQVNARNASGTTPGPVWSFTTALSTDIYSPEDSEAIQVYAYGNALHLVSTSQYDTQVDVYNIIGQLVMQGKTNGNTHSTFNTSALSNGIYVVKVVQNNKVVVSRRVPIQNQ